MASALFISNDMFTTTNVPNMVNYGASSDFGNPLANRPHFNFDGYVFNAVLSVKFQGGISQPLQVARACYI
jgi:hypothetical protein